MTYIQRRLLAPSIYNLPKLLELNLSKYFIFGPILNGFVDCFDLEVLDLCTNRVHGPLLTPIWKITTLRKLYLCQNYMFGEVSWPSCALSLSPKPNICPLLVITTVWYKPVLIWETWWALKVSKILGFNTLSDTLLSRNPRLPNPMEPKP